jgi:hypothetical protein
METKKPQIPGQKAQDKIVITHGSEPLRPQPAGAGQIDATVRFDNSRAAQQAEAEAALEAVKAKRQAREQAGEIVMPDATPADTLAVTIGDVTLSRSNADGWERKFSGDSAYVVSRDGEVLKGYAAFEALAEAILLTASDD